MAVAATRRKWLRSVHSTDASARRSQASCTKAVASRLCPGFSWASLAAASRRSSSYTCGSESCGDGMAASPFRFGASLLTADQAGPGPFGASGVSRGASAGTRRGRISRRGQRKPGMMSSPERTPSSSRSTGGPSRRRIFATLSSG